MRLRILAAAAVFTSALFAADPGLVSLAMPDSQIMAGVNVEQVMNSPLGQYALTHDTGTPWTNALPKLVEASGFDPRRDLREILACIDGLPANSQALVMARGTFDVAKILEAAHATGATIDTYKGVSIIGLSKTSALAFPDSTLAISGESPLVQAAIDRISAPAAISAALAVQVNQLSTTEDLWVVSMVPVSDFGPKPPQGAPATVPGPAAIYKEVQQSAGGLKFGADVVLTLQATFSTSQGATAAAAVLKALPGMAQMSNPKGETALLVAALQGLNVSADGTVLKISLSVPGQTVEQMLQSSHPAATHAENPPQPKIPGEMRSEELSAEPRAAGSGPQRIRVGANVQKAKLLQHVDAVYPPLAMQARISGVVRLNAIINKDGTVQRVTLASGHPLLVAPAIEAVKQWVYQPTLLNGQPVEVATQVEVEFSPAQ